MIYSENYDLENAIEETRFFLLQQYDSIETIKNSVRDIMSSAGLIIAFLGLLQFNLEGFSFSSPGIREYLLFITAGLYTLMIWIGMFLLMPVVMHTPMAIEKVTFRKLFYNKTPKRILENKLENYLQATQKNRPILKRASVFSMIVSGIYVSIITLLIVSLFV
jgi:hypothetical protein